MNYKNLYAVSSVVRSSESGLEHLLGYRIATSTAEAEGLALQHAREEFPKALVLNVIAMEIDQESMRSVLSALPNV